MLEGNFMKAAFSVYCRHLERGKKFYAKYYGGDGKIFRTITLKATTKVKAVVEAKQHLDQGVLSQTNNPYVIDFCKEFWSRDSLYVRSKARQGHILSDRYILDSKKFVELRFGKLLTGKRMSELSPVLIEQAIDDMEKTGLGHRSINIALATITVPVNWYSKMHRQPNPLQYCMKLHETPKERGALSASEVNQLAKQEVTPRIKTAVMLGALCGLRLGEVRGLQWSDVDLKGKVIHIIHNSPSYSDEIKDPKWGSSRVVPLPLVLAELLPQVKAMSGSSESFVIFNEKHKDKPIEEKSIIRGYHRMLDGIKIGKEVRRERNICFHSLRHTFVSLSRASGIPDFVVQRLAGHKSAQMMERYSHAENVIDYSKVAESMESLLKNAT